MPSTDIRDSTAIVTGASRGFGRGIAEALSRAGVTVVGVARNEAVLQEVRAELGGSFIPMSADAGDPPVEGRPFDPGRRPVAAAPRSEGRDGLCASGAPRRVREPGRRSA
jgi:NAD(P)-dependent dehydrogenase (short-subunit alcohol dehydrogenase family)